jgi:DNA-binding response OmpR family regulator
MIKILIIDENEDRAMSIISQLGTGEVQATLITHADKAKNNLSNNEYDVIMIGDKISGGDTYDVGLSMIQGAKNKRSSVLCIGRHVSRATRLSNLIGTGRSLVVNTNLQAEIDAAAAKLSSFIVNKNLPKEEE